MAPKKQQRSSHRPARRSQRLPGRLLPRIGEISALAWLMAALALALPLTADAQLEGVPLEEAIRSLESPTLRIFYSTDLVRPWMRVESEPPAGAPLVTLAAILEPHGLATELAANGAVLIVRSDAPVSAAPPATDRPAPQRPAPAANSLRPRPLEEIVVSASRYPFQRPGGGTAATLTAAEIEYQPGLGDDALRPTQRLPGAASQRPQCPHSRQRRGYRRDARSVRRPQALRSVSPEGFSERLLGGRPAHRPLDGRLHRCVPGRVRRAAIERHRRRVDRRRRAPLSRDRGQLLQCVAAERRPGSGGPR